MTEDKLVKILDETIADVEMLRQERQATMQAWTDKENSLITKLHRLRKRLEKKPDPAPEPVAEKKVYVRTKKLRHCETCGYKSKQKKRFDEHSCDRVLRLKHIATRPRALKDRAAVSVPKLSNAIPPKIIDKLQGDYTVIHIVKEYKPPNLPSQEKKKRMCPICVTDQKTMLYLGLHMRKTHNAHLSKNGDKVTGKIICNACAFRTPFVNIFEEHVCNPVVRPRVSVTA